MGNTTKRARWLLAMTRVDKKVTDFHNAIYIILLYKTIALDAELICCRLEFLT